MIVEARNLTLLEGMTGANWNGAPIRSGPTLHADDDGVEWVTIWTGDGENLVRYLLRADVRVDIGEVDPWLPA